MFDISWGKLVIIGVVALLVIGPKELPAVLRQLGQWMTKIRRMAAEFQGQFNEAMREAEMADVKKAFDDVKDVASGFTTNNIMTSLTKDVSDAMAIDKADNLDTPPAVPTTPEPPTPETFVEAETHAQETAAVNEPLAITREVQPSPVETPAAAHDGAAAPDAASPDVLKDAKAS